MRNKYFLSTPQYCAQTTARFMTCGRIGKKLLIGNDMSTNKRSIDPAIIAALIGVMGTVCVTAVTLYVNYFGPRPPSPTAIVQPTWTVAVPATATIANTPVPTDTVPVGEPSSTPAPDTPTPQPTFTSAPPVIGDDWANNCISALWQPYPNIQTEQKDGCLVPLVDKFYTANGHL